MTGVKVEKSAICQFETDKLLFTAINTNINLQETLKSGQVFHFKKLDSGCWTGFVEDELVILRQKGEEIEYAEISENSKSTVENFLNLNESPDESIIIFKGLRFFSNGLLSTIFSFICSQNNFVERITSMVQFLYSSGESVEVDGRKIHKFPEVSKLVDIEEILRANSFGYRAKYICKAAQHLMENKEIYTHENLTTIGHLEARKELVKLMGVGNKVADCICLMSLRYFDVVPIDTHVFKHSCKLFPGENLKISQ